MNMPWFVWIYLCDKAYGGPEEGGWWYDYGEPIFPGHWAWEELWRHCSLVETHEAALAARDKVQATLDATINHGRISVSELLSEGIFRVYLSQDLPAVFPESRPHWE